MIKPFQSSHKGGTLYKCEMKSQSKPVPTATAKSNLAAYLISPSNHVILNPDQHATASLLPTLNIRRRRQGVQLSPSRPPPLHPTHTNTAKMKCSLPPTLPLLALLIAQTRALYFYIDGPTQKCFFEDLPKDTLVVGTFTTSNARKYLRAGRLTILIFNRPLQCPAMGLRFIHLHLPPPSSSQNLTSTSA
jgi:hypothetical protein